MKTSKRKRKPNGQYKKAKKPTTIEITCPCGEWFQVTRALYEQAAVQKTREIYCPIGHELSWRGGTLGARLKSEDLIRRELESQQRLMANIKDLFINHRRIVVGLEADLAREEKGIPRPMRSPEIHMPQGLDAIAES